MEDILELLFNGLKEVMKFLLYVIIFQIVLFNIGRFTLLSVTIGKYPRYRHVERDADKIAFFGFFVLLCMWTVVALYNNLNT